MNQFMVLMKNDAVKNMVIGLSVSILVPIVVNLLVPIVRPLARSTLKGGILVYEKGRETVAEIGEVVDDLVAEVQEELQEAREQKTAVIEAGSASDEVATESGEKR